MGGEINTVIDGYYTGCRVLNPSYGPMRIKTGPFSDALLTRDNVRSIALEEHAANAGVCVDVIFADGNASLLLLDADFHKRLTLDLGDLQANRAADARHLESPAPAFESSGAARDAGEPVFENNEPAGDSLPPALKTDVVLSGAYEGRLIVTVFGKAYIDTSFFGTMALDRSSVREVAISGPAGFETAEALLFDGRRCEFHPGPKVLAALEKHCETVREAGRKTNSPPAPQTNVITAGEYLGRTVVSVFGKAHIDTSFFGIMELDRTTVEEVLVSGTRGFEKAKLFLRGGGRCEFYPDAKVMASLSKHCNVTRDFSQK